jgi:hypothetical protein
MSTWEFIAVYQHVAKSANRAARTLLRETLGAALNVAKSENKRVMFVGDFNAAPAGGRCCYAERSCAAREDKGMDVWMCLTGLINVLSIAGPQHTWRSFEGPKAATLDRVLMLPGEAHSAPVQICWSKHSQVFDHAMIVTRLHYSTAGIGFAGASHLDSDNVPPPQARIDLKKLQANLAEFQP